MNPSEYMQTKEMLETAEEMVNTQKELTVNSIVSKGYNPNKIKTICTILQNTVDKKLAPIDQTEEESEILSLLYEEIVNPNFRLHITADFVSGSADAS